MASREPTYNCLCGYPEKHDKWIQCDNAEQCAHPYSNGWYHTMCVDKTDAEVEEMEYNGTEWLCNWCFSANRK